MQCFHTDAAGMLVADSPQPSDLTTCSLVVGSYSEFSSDFVKISPSDGAQIAVAILGVWAVGYVFRLLIRALFIDNDERKSE